MLQKVKLLKTLISIGSYDGFLEKIIQLARSGKSSYICFANVHMLMDAYKLPDFNEVVNGADIVTPDGRPLSLLMKYQHGIAQQRVCGMDLFPELLEAAERNNLSVYFYGSTNDVLSDIEEKANKEFPKLRIAGSYSPPFRPLTFEEDTEVIKRINSTGANLIFVSLGCPKQEKWMHAHKNKIPACMLGLGQAFLTYTGRERRLPKWARDFSLEWAYRFYLEPKRLWKRFLYGNSKFLYLAGKALIIQKTAKLLK